MKPGRSSASEPRPYKHHAPSEGRYPHDTLYLIGFSLYARQMQPKELAASGWERVYGTNMHHAFNLAGRLLSQHPRATRQVIMVTDGEPTAHLEGDRAKFNWPPIPKTIRLTLMEASKLARAARMVVITGTRLLLAVLRILISSSREVLPLGVLMTMASSPFFSMSSALGRPSLSLKSFFTGTPAFSSSAAVPRQSARSSGRESRMGCIVCR